MSGAPGEPRLRLGNDVVDLGEPRVRGKSTDGRFLRRILHASELELVDASPDRDAELWSIWAAKEAAYKVVSKLEGSPPPFVHERFVVAWEPGGAGDADGRMRRGSVGWGERRVRVEVDVHPEVVHSVACARSPASKLRASGSSGPAMAAGAGQGAVTITSPTAGGGSPELAALDHVRRTLMRLDVDAAPWTLPEVDLLAALTEREREAVHSRPSAAVRLGAKADLAEALGLERDRVEIVCGPGPRGRRPPEVLLDGAPSALDVSLSHHGVWIAWALAGPDLLPAPRLSDSTPAPEAP